MTDHSPSPAAGPVSSAGPVPDGPVEADYVIVGGGTAGAIVAARLSADPGSSVVVLEWGPSDEDEPRARSIRRWAEMLEGEYDLDYRSVPNERGNSAIRQARLRVLGGCSTANTMIAWKPLRADLEEWVSLGAHGWDPDTVWAAHDQLDVPVSPVAPTDQNPLLADAVRAASAALDVPLRTRWNDQEVRDGAGFFEIGYDPATNDRSSSSRVYLHPVMHERSTLDVLLGHRALRLLWQQREDREDRAPRAVGVLARTEDGSVREVRARREVIVCAGAIDTPRLLQLSGVGPRDVLEAAGVPVVVEAPGVGENLMDHAEGLVVWEATRPVPPTCATGWDAGALLRLGPAAQRPDVVMHFPVETVADHAVAAGLVLPPHHVSIAANVAKPRSRGRVWITSPDPEAPPAIDYRSFTDPDGEDERVLVAAVRAARRIGATEPLASWIVREVFPGPDVVEDEDVSRIARTTHQTVYHVSGTARMGATDDPMAVTDPRLRVRGTTGLRVVDASVFPTLTAVNPVITVMTVAERAAQLITEDAAAPGPRDHADERSAPGPAAATISG